MEVTFGAGANVSWRGLARLRAARHGENRRGVEGYGPASRVVVTWSTLGDTDVGRLRGTARLGKAGLGWVWLGRERQGKAVGAG